jgi:hypothetical membrane protein
MTRQLMTRAQAETAAGTASRRGWISVAAWAGIVGPVLFTAGFLAQEAFRTAEYSPVSEPVSALEAGPHGWVQQVNFVVFGVLTMAFAIGLHRGIRPTRAGAAGPAMLFVSGIGLLLAAALPLREDAAGVTYDPGGHFVAGVIFFCSAAAGLLVLSRRLAQDPHWRSLSGYIATAGAAGLVSFVLLGAFVIPDDAPLNDWAGLIQRFVILVILFPARVVLALRLLNVGRE